MPYRLEKLGIENLDDGKASTALNSEIDRAAADVVTRPKLKEKRTITLTIEIVPEEDGETGVNFPQISWNVKHAVPGRKGLTSRAIVEDGEIKINLDDAQVPGQTQLFVLERKGETAKEAQ